jgi:hypothetical protein
VALVGGSTFTVTVTGANFARGAVVRWNGADRPTAYVSAGRLEAALSAADLATPGTGALTVWNPAPGGGASNSLALPVAYPAPAVSAISPLTATAGGPAFTLVITGTGFVNGVSTILWNGAVRPTFFVAGTQLTTTVPAGDVAAVGAAQVTVSNPAPGGGLSQPPATLSIVP